jgi:hypothetical protein
VIAQEARGMSRNNFSWPFETKTGGFLSINAGTLENCYYLFFL